MSASRAAPIQRPRSPRSPPCETPACGCDTMIARTALALALLLPACGTAPRAVSTAPPPATAGPGTPTPPIPIVIARGQGVVTALAADATHAYWGRKTGEIIRAPLGGGASEQVATTAGEPMAICLGADTLWVAVALA